MAYTLSRYLATAVCSDKGMCESPAQKVRAGL